MPRRAPEVIGGDFIELRFGGWGKALASIGVKNGGRIPTPSVENTKLFRDEYERQRAATSTPSAKRKKPTKRSRGRKNRPERPKNRPRRFQNLLLKIEYAAFCGKCATRFYDRTRILVQLNKGIG